MDWLLETVVLMVCCNLIVIVIFTTVAEKINLMDVPDARKLHSESVPAVGGLAIYITLLMGMLLQDFSTLGIWVVLAATIVVVFGAIDDAYGLDIRMRLLSQVVGSCLMIFGYGTWIETLGSGALIDGDLHFLIAIPFTLFATVGLTNSFNMIDGIDGLASGQFVISLSLLCISMFLAHGAVYRFDWLVILMSVVLSFFVVNISLLPLQKVFLGDAGSLLLGFMLGWIFIFFSQDPLHPIEPVSILWCIVIPVFDTLTVVFLRLRNGASPFKADRRHIHHLIQDQGFNEGMTLLLIIVLSAVVGLVGVVVTATTTPEVSLVLYLILLFGYVRWVSSLWTKNLV